MAKKHCINKIHPLRALDSAILTLVKKKTAGSALLVSLIIMGILLTLSIGVSELIIGSLRDSQKLIERMGAWYAAEAAVEQGLAAITEGPVGFAKEERNAKIGDARATYDYTITATAQSVPLLQQYEIKNESDRFAVLGLNESVTIPLFSGPKSEQSVKNMRVDYYLPQELEHRFNRNVDILRWKIFGLNAAGKMEVLNEFLPANKGNSPDNPTCLGTSATCWNGAKFYQSTPDGFELANYYSIKKFLSDHTQNFLVLTNIINIDLIPRNLSLSEKQKIAALYYRVVDEDGQAHLSLPTVRLEADGRVGDTTQSLNVAVKRETFLPVFNYALYRTVEK